LELANKGVARFYFVAFQYLRWGLKLVFPKKAVNAFWGQKNKQL